MNPQIFLKRAFALILSISLILPFAVVPTLANNSFTLRVGESMQLTASTLGDVNVQIVGWFSNTSDVVIVSTSRSGNMHYCTIRATGTQWPSTMVYLEWTHELGSGFRQTQRAQFYITTQAALVAPTDISLSPETLDLNVGDNFLLSSTITPPNANTSTSLSWSSSDTSVVSVIGLGDHRGSCTARGPGTATITVRTVNGKTAECQVTVAVPPLALVSSNPANNAIDIPINQILQVTYNVPIQVGESYEDIQLYNVTADVAVSSGKQINGNTLELTPVSLFEYDTEYRLTIPENSLENSVGVPLEKDTLIEFTTRATAIQLEKPTASPRGGGVAMGQQIILSTATPGAALYYTLDGSEPTANSLLYSEPIVVFTPIALRAIAIHEGYDDSEILEADYHIDDQPQSIVWENDVILSPNVEAHPFAGVYTIEGDLHIGDNVTVYSHGVSQAVLNVKGKLTLGKNAVIVVRNQYYPAAPSNAVNASTSAGDMESFAAYTSSGYALYPEVYGRGGNGGNGGNGSPAVPNPTESANNAYNGGSGGGGGAGGFGGGTGGVGGNGANGRITSRGGFNGTGGGNGEDNGGAWGIGGYGGTMGGHGGSSDTPAYGSTYDINGDEGDSVWHYNTSLGTNGAGGGGGGGGGYGGGVLTITAEEIAYDETEIPRFIVSGQRRGMGGARGNSYNNGAARPTSNATPGSEGTNGAGGVLIINAENAQDIPNSVYNLGPSSARTINKGRHGIVIGNPTATFLNLNSYAEPIAVRADKLLSDSANVAFTTKIFEGDAYSEITFTNSAGLPIDGTIEIVGSVLRFFPTAPLDEGVNYQLNIPGNALLNIADEPNTQFKLNFRIPPQLTGTVEITGVPVFDEILNADTTEIFNSSGTSSGFSYNWKRGEESIEGADQAQYLLTQEDIGNIITVTVTAEGYVGSVTSQPTDIVEKAEQLPPTIFFAVRAAPDSDYVVTITNPETGALYSKDGITFDESNELTFEKELERARVWVKLIETETHLESEVADTEIELSAYDDFVRCGEHCKGEGECDDPCEVPIIFELGDCNNDGKINIADLTYLKYSIVELENFPPNEQCFIVAPKSETKQHPDANDITKLRRFLTGIDRDLKS